MRALDLCIFARLYMFDDTNEPAVYTALQHKLSAMSHELPTYMDQLINNASNVALCAVVVLDSR